MASTNVILGPKLNCFFFGSSPTTRHAECLDLACMLVSFSVHAWYSGSGQTGSSHHIPVANRLALTPASDSRLGLGLDVSSSPPASESPS